MEVAGNCQGRFRKNNREIRLYETLEDLEVPETSTVGQGPARIIELTKGKSGNAPDCALDLELIFEVLPVLRPVKS